MPTTVIIGELTIGALLAQAAISYAISFAVTRIFGKKPPKMQDNGVRQQIPPATVNSLPVVYGDAYLGGVFVDACLTTDQKQMYYVMAISSISPNGQFSYDTTKMYYGDRLITFAGDDQTRVASLTDGDGNVDTKINTNLNISLYTSDASGNITNINGQNPWSSSTNSMGSGSGLPSNLQWTSTNRKMYSMAFAIVRLNYNQDAGTTQLQPITFKVKQALNGTGVAKPGDVWYDYMTNTEYGGAVDTDLIDSSSATALNTYSDQLITFTDNQGNPATQARYRINGVFDTGTSVLENIETLLTCCDSWMSYNAALGKWSIVVNKAESTAMAFDDSNIVGDIKVTTVDINQMVNQIEAKFPNALNKDIPDYVLLETPSYLLYPNEPVNKYTTEFNMTNNSVQAQYLANRILEQAREDLIVSFKTTYVGIQVNAGDVVSVTNSSYGWNQKLFRVMKVNEASLQDGTLGAALELNEYNSQVYDDKDITQFSPAPNSYFSSPDFFSALSAPVVGDLDPTATVPSFSVSCTMPATGRVTSVTLFYTTTPTPTTTDWTTLNVQTATNSQPFTNSSVVKFTHVSLPTGTYYFAFKVANNISQSQLSALSDVLNWTPTPSVAVEGTFIATFNPSSFQVPYISTPSFTGIAPKLYGTTASGSVDFVTSQTDADSAFIANTWRIGGSPYTGNSDIVKSNITIGNPTDGGTYALFPAPTAMSDVSATLSVPVRYKDSNGTVVQGATASIQFVLSFQGQSSRICYTKTTLSSLDTSPATITTAGNSSFPPNNSWGTGTVWQATPQTIVAGESVYQSDGIYNPVLDQTVWNVPYLSNLKVGQLSAISAYMGTLVAGTINTGAGAAFLTMGADSNGSVWRLTRSNATLLPPAYLIDNTPNGGSGGGAPSSMWITQSNRSDGECLMINNGGGGNGIAIGDSNATTNGNPLFTVNGYRQEGQAKVTGIGTGLGQHAMRFLHYNTVGGTLNASGIAATEGGKAFYAEVGGYGPFTGVHDGLIPINTSIEIGDILVDTTLIAKNGVSDVLYEITQSSISNQVAIGIYASKMPLNAGAPAAMIDRTLTVAYDQIYDPVTGELVSEQFKNPPTLQYEEIKDLYDLVNINAVGEGQINVCGENGDIAVGDFIVTSSMLGKGMKQSDDILHNYTVARAREAVTFSSQTEVKMIACIYLCG